MLFNFNSFQQFQLVTPKLVVANLYPKLFSIYLVHSDNGLHYK